jgi:aubergine-like protein
MLVAEVKRGRGGRIDRVYLVPESCRETGLNDELRASGFMMKLMKFKPRPDERVRKYQDFLQRVFTEQKELFQAWGIRLRQYNDRPALSALDAGRIPAGRITFGATTHDLASRSMFDREAQSGIYSAPTTFRWAILSLQDDRENVSAKNTFINEFQAACQRASMNVDQPVMQECPRNAQQWLEHMRNLRNADFLLLILPAKGRKKDDMNLYKLTKRLAISELGIPTQCVLHKTLTNPKGVTSIVSKILTQIVSKLNNGAAWGLVQPECIDVPTMVCGVDVWHGAGKSILGFTASLDACYSKYTSEARQQALKEELSSEVAACVLASCEAFNTLNQT